MFQDATSLACRSSMILIYALRTNYLVVRNIKNKKKIYFSEHALFKTKKMNNNEQQCKIADGHIQHSLSFYHIKLDLKGSHKELKTVNQV